MKVDFSLIKFFEQIYGTFLHNIFFWLLFFSNEKKYTFDFIVIFFLSYLVGMVNNVGFLREGSSKQNESAQHDHESICLY